VIVPHELPLDVTPGDDREARARRVRDLRYVELLRRPAHRLITHPLAGAQVGPAAG
jgi:hypothetical protein